jgi:hypothetical protein
LHNFVSYSKKAHDNLVDVDLRLQVYKNQVTEQKLPGFTGATDRGQRKRPRNKEPSVNEPQGNSHMDTTALSFDNQCVAAGFQQAGFKIEEEEDLDDGWEPLNLVRGNLLPVSRLLYTWISIDYR